LLSRFQGRSLLNQDSTIVRAAHRVILSAGWERRIIAFAAGALGSLAMAPFDLFPLLAIPMTVAVWLIDGAAQANSKSGGISTFRSAVAAAKDGWWLGFGYFVAGLWWLGAAFLVEADQFAWALPLGVLGLPAGLALFTAIGFFLSRLMWSSDAARILALAAGLGASEWLRGVVLTGFPWNDFGLALGGNLWLGQFASIVGLHGLTFIAIALAATPATLADDSTKRRWWRHPAALALIVMAGIAAFGALRLGGSQTTFASQPRLRIMQPNLPQDAKFKVENKDEILEHYIRLSGSTTSDHPEGLATVTHLIWPESAFPFIISMDAASLAKVGAIIARGSHLITGAARAEVPRDSKARGTARAIFFNSIHVIEAGGAIADTYDKVHLVPFGEYLPFSKLLEALRLRQFVHIPGGFEPGLRQRALSVPGLPGVAPLVCYEAIFPGEVIPKSGNLERPGVMLNVTNDAWFGMTPGPYQHFAAARLRTIEEGLPLVRAANNGISAVIDPYGRVVARLGLGETGVLDARLPNPLGPTPFSRWPLAGPAALGLLMAAGAFLLRPRRRHLR
jgi:apolipoprotein N-acyltransferase